SAAYTRALASQFEALADGQPTPPPGTPPVPPNDGTQYFPPCNRYLAPAGAGDPERIAGLESYAKCSSTGGIDFSKVGFGSENQWNFGIQGNWEIFTGGRTLALNRAASSARTAADIELVSQRARLSLDITEAYFDAVLADRLVAIAESSLVLSENVLGQTRLARQVGNQSEFDLLRAQVTRDNQMPALLQRRTDRELAYARVKQMLNIPGTEQVSLTTGLGNERELLQMVGSTGAPAPTAEGDSSSLNRAPVRQLGESLRAAQEQLTVARRAWVPTVTLSSQYGRLSFPRTGLPDFNNLLTNWTVSLTATMPLYTGGRLRGQAMVAQAAVRDAEARYEQVREAASLDALQAHALLKQAQAALAASQGTTGQATKAYSIAEVRYREGLSTQVELNDSRLLLQQAAANSALAVRNMQVARMRVALLRDLPLGAGAIVIPLQSGAPAGLIAPQQIAPQGPAAAPAGTTRAASSTVIIP
ncbi:MAG TPA: TolC family protein, partial [Vicinamibacterales bacterium]|nr:TolC family protein [Vicinamibacterales bacterium]